jgi:hypothetical protein
MRTYQVKVESYATGDRHVIDVRAMDGSHAVEQASHYGVVIECRLDLQADTEHWTVELSDGFTVEYQSNE